MRILLLNWRDIGNPLAGGAEVHVQEVFGRAAARGWAPVLLSCRYTGAAAEDEMGGVRVVRCGTPSTYPLAVPRAYHRLRNQFRPELVVDFLNKLPLLSPWYVRGTRLACFVHHLFGAAAPMELGRLAGAAVRASERLVPRVYRRVPFLTGSASTAAELEGMGIARDRIQTVPYGAAVEQYRPGAKSPAPSVLYLGRLKRYKGVDHLLRLMPELLRRFPPLQLHIAGDGDDGPRLERLCRALSLDTRVTFHGRVSEPEKVRLYQEAWVLCFPTRKEGFGLTIAEAALCGTPTVGYAVPGVVDAVSGGATGLLVPHGDRAALGAALARCLADAMLRDRLGQAARSRYQGFTWDAAADVTLAALEAIAGEAASELGLNEAARD